MTNPIPFRTKRQAQERARLGDMRLALWTLAPMLSEAESAAWKRRLDEREASFAPKGAPFVKTIPKRNTQVTKDIFAHARSPKTALLVLNHMLEKMDLGSQRITDPQRVLADQLGLKRPEAHHAFQALHFVGAICCPERIDGDTFWEIDARLAITGDAWAQQQDIDRQREHRAANPAPKVPKKAKASKQITMPGMPRIPRKKTADAA